MTGWRKLCTAYPAGFGPRSSVASRRSSHRESSPFTSTNTLKVPSTSSAWASVGMGSPLASGTPARLPVHCELLVRVRPDSPVQLEVGDLELPLALRDEHVEPLDELYDLLAVQIARDLVQLALVGLRGAVRGTLPLVIPSLQSPDIGPMRRRGVVGAEQIERRGDPLIEEALDDLGWHLPGLHDAEQPVVAGAQVVRLLLEHRAHRARQRIERGDGEHFQLELAVAVDELRVREEVEPVVDDLEIGRAHV